MSLAELEQRVDEFAQHAYNRALAVPVVGSVLRSKLATAAWMRVTHTSVHSLQQLRSYLRDVSVGATAAVRGLFAGAQEPAVIESLRKSLLYVLLTSAILFSVLFALFLPPSLCLALWHWVSPLPGDSLMLWEQRLSPWAWIRSSSTVAPSVVLFCFSQISGFEECFFALLAQPNQPDRTGIELEKALRARARPTMLASCWAYVQRAFPLLALGLFVTILQHVPLLGRFVPSLWLLKFASKLGLMKSGGNVSNKIGIAAVLLVIVYSQTLQSLCYHAFRLYLSLMSLSRELLDTYLCRLDSPSPVAASALDSQHAAAREAIRVMRSSDLSECARDHDAVFPAPLPPLPHPSARAFLAAHSALLCGVGLVFILPFSRSSLLGLLLAPVAHAAAACVLLSAVRTEKANSAASASAAAAASSVECGSSSSVLLAGSSDSPLDDGFVHVDPDADAGSVVERVAL